MDQPELCVVCGAATERALVSWVTRCPSCAAWSSSLRARGSEVDSETRIAGLEPLRRENFRLILDLVERERPLAGSTVLEVGSGYGWFLEEAAARGAGAVGIEPDARVANRSRMAVRQGSFPAALVDGETFDIVAFNDVLEHIPDIRGAVAAARRALAPNGVISLNIPTSDGLTYRVATLLARAGIRGPFRRLWQYGLGSPHVHYLPRHGIVRILEESGFSVVRVEPLPAIMRAGLWQRVHTFARPNVASVLSFVALWSAAGVLRRPRFSDVVLVVAACA